MFGKTHLLLVLNQSVQGLNQCLQASVGHVRDLNQSFPGRIFQGDFLSYWGVLGGYPKVIPRSLVGLPPRLRYHEKQRATDFPPWNWASRSDQTVLCHPCAVAMHHVLPELNVVSGNFNSRDKNWIYPQLIFIMLFGFNNLFGIVLE